MPTLSEFVSFIYSQLFTSLPAPTQSLAGKTVIITGSNVGLGKEAARTVARLGVTRLILAVRNVEKGEEAKRDIEQSTGIGPDVIQVWPLDLASYQSVREFAARATKDLARLDLLLENAGLATADFRLAEGNELTITVNVISTFLLGFLLIPKLKDTAQKFNTRPNLTIVSSEVHAWTTIPERKVPGGQLFQTLNNKDDAVMSERYLVSKLLEVFAIRAFADRHPAATYPITVNYVNPGLCHSELARDADGMGIHILKFLLARSTEYGSRTLVHAGFAGEETHGQYVHNCVVTPPSTFVLSEEGAQVQAQVWRELSAKLEEIQSGLVEGL